MLIKTHGIKISFQRTPEDGQRWAAMDRVRQTVPGARSCDGEGSVAHCWASRCFVSPARWDRPMTRSADDAVTIRSSYSNATTQIDHYMSGGAIMHLIFKIHGSLGPHDSDSQTAFRSVQPFLQGSRSWPTQSDHATPHVAVARIFATQATGPTDLWLVFRRGSFAQPGSRRLLEGDDVGAAWNLSVVTRNTLRGVMF